MPHPLPLKPELGLARVSVILEACRGAGRRAPAVGSTEPGICSVQGANLRHLAITRSHYRAVPVMTEHFV
jgi:hypothetical protein